MCGFFPFLLTLKHWLLPECSLSYFQANPPARAQSFEVKVLQPKTLQKQPLHVRFLGVLSATTLPKNV